MVLPIVENLVEKTHSIMSCKWLHQGFGHAKNVISDEMKVYASFTLGQIQASIVQGHFELAVVPDFSVIFGA